MAGKNVSKRKKTGNKDKKRILLLFLTVIVLIIVLIGTVFKDWVQVMSNRQETKELENKYQELLEEEASLNSEVFKLQYPTYFARYAREKYLYSKDCETILRIVDNSEGK